MMSWSDFFFFSSRRRHTRCSRDWSSDVCSSDLHVKGELDRSPFREHKLPFQRFLAAGPGGGIALATMARRSGVGMADLAREADGAMPLEMYLPVPEHRRTWTGDANEIGRASCRERV